MHVLIPQSNTTTFKEALAIMNKEQLPYAIGGAFAMYFYSGIWRNTNDLDLYVERPFVHAAVDALTDSGFQDYGEMAAGDRAWIYHATKDGVLVDVIWAPPNHVADIDASFYRKAVTGIFLDLPASFLPADGLIWTKIFTLNRHRCDWPDIFRIVRAKPDSLDWRFLVDKVGENWPVLLSFILIFDWVYPSERAAIPSELRDELLARTRELDPMQPAGTRELLLDPWVYSRPISP